MQSYINVGKSSSPQYQPGKPPVIRARRRSRPWRGDSGATNAHSQVLTPGGLICDPGEGKIQQLDCQC